MEKVNETINNLNQAVEKITNKECKVVFVQFLLQ